MDSINFSQKNVQQPVKITYAVLKRLTIPGLIIDGCGSQEIGGWFAEQRSDLGTHKHAQRPDFFRMTDSEAPAGCACVRCPPVPASGRLTSGSPRTASHSGWWWPGLFMALSERLFCQAGAVTKMGCPF